METPFMKTTVSVTAGWKAHRLATSFRWQPLFYKTSFWFTAGSAPPANTESASPSSAASRSPATNCTTSSLHTSLTAAAMPTVQRFERTSEKLRKSSPPADHNTVQKLYDVCKAAFASAKDPFPSKALKRVRKILDRVKPSDVGLDERFFSQQDRGFGFFGRLNGRSGTHVSTVARWAPPVSYLHIHECKKLSMGIFCLPTSAVIPLHNHPGMTVLSKLLYGSMHVKAYDWVDPLAKCDPTKPRLAKMVVDQVLTAPCEPSVLFPTSGGNMHVFTAVTACAVLDVLAPPYSPEDGRHCTYFRVLPYSSHSGSSFGAEVANTSEQNLAWLEEVQHPDDFVVKGASYMGPVITP